MIMQKRAVLIIDLVPERLGINIVNNIPNLRLKGVIILKAQFINFQIVR